MFKKLSSPAAAEKAQLKMLWADSFCEEQKAVDIIFDRYFDLFDAYCAEADGKIISALYLVSGSLNGKRAHYLCGAATLPEYRRRGIMKGLIEYALSRSAEDGDKYSLLFPANESLYSFYSGLGYASACSAKKFEISRKQLENMKSECRLCNVTSDFEDLQKACFGRDFLMQSGSFLSFAAKYYGVYNVKLLQDWGCAALVDDDGKTADVIYSVYTDFEKLRALLLKNTAAQEFVFTVKSDNRIFKNAKTEKYGMIKPLDGSTTILENIYIGITLS